MIDWCQWQWQWIGVSGVQMRTLCAMSKCALLPFHLFCFLFPASASPSSFFSVTARKSTKRTKRMELLISFNHIFFISQFLPHAVFANGFAAFCADERASARHNVHVSLQLQADYLLHCIWVGYVRHPLSIWKHRNSSRTRVFFVLVRSSFLWWSTPAIEFPVAVYCVLHIPRILFMRYARAYYFYFSI